MAHAARHDLIGQIGQNFFRRTVAFDGLIEGKLAIREIGIAAPDQDQIAGQAAFGRKLAARFDGCAHAEFGAERGERERRGEQLGVRGRREIAIGVFFVEHRSGVGVGDQQTPGTAVGAVRSELRFGARGESLGIAARRARCGGGGVRGTRARRANLRGDCAMAERDRREEKQHASQASRC